MVKASEKLYRIKKSIIVTWISMLYIFFFRHRPIVYVSHLLNNPGDGLKKPSYLCILLPVVFLAKHLLFLCLPLQTDILLRDVSHFWEVS